MTAAQPWVKWRFDKWRNDEGLKLSSLAARGLWAELLAIMHGCEPYGHLSVRGRAPTPRQIAALVGNTTEREVTGLLAELEENGVFSRSDDGLIYCRRMVRDNAAREAGRSNGLQGGNPALTGRQAKQDKGDDHNGDNHTRNPAPLTGGVNPPLYDRNEIRDTRYESPPKPPAPKRPAPPGDDEHFSAFWAAYPRKDDKGHARVAWRAAVKKASPEAIIAGLKRHQFSPDPRFRPLAATWLNGERWGDGGSLLPAPPEPSPNNPTGREFTPLSGGL